MEDDELDNKELFDRIEKEGAVVISTNDGHVFGFKADVLKRLWEDAEAKPRKMAIVFVRKALKENDA